MGGGAEGARERERIPSKFHAQCPAWCRLHLMTLKSWTEPNSRVGCSTDWATQGASRCHPLYKNLKIFLSFSIPLYKWSVLSTVDLWVSLKMWWSFYFQHFSFKKPWYLLTFFFFFCLYPPNLQIDLDPVPSIKSLLTLPLLGDGSLLWNL